MVRIAGWNTRVCARARACLRVGRRIAGMEQARGSASLVRVREPVTANDWMHRANGRAGRARSFSPLERRQHVPTCDAARIITVQRLPRTRDTGIPARRGVRTSLRPPCRVFRHESVRARARDISIRRGESSRGEKTVRKSAETRPCAISGRGGVHPRESADSRIICRQGHPCSPLSLNLSLSIYLRRGLNARELREIPRAFGAFHGDG